MNCLYCGNELKITFRTKGRKFCSKDCSNRYYSKKRTNDNPRFCVVCGKKLSGKRTVYCSNDCKIRFEYLGKQNPEPEIKKQEPKKIGRPKKKLSLSEVNALARKEGLKYGEYVAKYGL